MDILNSIQSPADIKKLTISELEHLCSEIRHRIIDVMAINGGHLGSNLGVVELTLALHQTFNSPIDQFIFDVSHQIYTHKILTGRLAKFPTIRQYKGLSGFAHPKESEHDHFYAGHAGTAISLGLGVAKARDMNGENFHVLPIIGDATFTCGLALEALNNLPTDLKRFTIILNDNNMSISNNVGAITQILDDTPAPFFEQYGLRYIGPIDGHNLEELLRVLNSLKDSAQPTILHVITVKGKGLEIAEANPISWHGCSPFDKVTGKKSGKPPSKSTFPQIFGKHLLKMVEVDPTIITITPATPLGACITPLMEKYPERCIDVGIAEGHAVTYSGAIAKQPNTKVVCSIYATFLQRAFDNLFQDVCLQESPVVFAIDRGGIANSDGTTHHGIYDISFLNAMPNMIICQPRNGLLLKELLESAFDWKQPTAIRYPNIPTDEPNYPLSKRPLGKGEILERGTDVALIALGHMNEIALEVGQLLAKEGIAASIVDPIFLKPLDTELLTNIFMSHPYIATIEEHSLSGGMGMILNSFAFRNGFSNIQMRNFGIPDIYLQQGTHKEMLASVGLDAESIARQILKDYAEVTRELPI